MDYHTNIKIKNDISYYLIWIILISSIGVEPYIIFEKKITFNYLINFIRTISPLILILFFIYKIIKQKITIPNQIFVILLFIFLIQLIGIFFESSKTDFLNENGSIKFFNKVTLILWIIKPISCILFFWYLSNTEKYSQKIKNIFLFTIIFLGIFGLLNFFIAFYEFILKHPNSYLMYSGLKSYWTLILDQQVPQVLGISRNLIIFIILSLFFYWYSYKKNKEFKFKYLIFIFICIGISGVYLLQSRLHNFFLVIIFLVVIFYDLRNYVEKIRILASLLILSFLFIISVNISKTIISSKSIKFSEQFLNNLDSRIYNLDSRILSKNKLLESQIKKEDGFTSGRLNDWKNLVNSLTDKKLLFFGHGARADRRLINQTASSGYIYAISSGGIFCLLAFLYLQLKITIILLKLYLSKFPKNIKIFDIIPIVIIIFLLLRAIVETSFIDWG